MLIQCTKKLLDQMKTKPEPPRTEEYDPLFSWHANLLTINRRKAVVLVNDSNRYVIVLYGLVAKDFKNLNEHIFEAIRTVFREESIKEDVIEQYVQHSPTITYTKTRDRTSVARMNMSIEPVTFIDDLWDFEATIQSVLSKRASRFLVGHGKDKYIEPNEELYKDLEVFSGKRVVQMKAVQIKVKLRLENHEVWRRLIIPLHLTFHQLHKILQIAFGWREYHLHEFYIYDQKVGQVNDNEWNINHPAYNQEGKKPILNIVADKEAFHYGEDIPMKLDYDIHLSDFLPEHKTVKYIYDFGDSWRHDLEVENFIEDHDKSYPVCLDSEGITPPEDVGGEPGFEQFLEAIDDESDPEHEHLVRWAESQRWSKDFDIVHVNFRLKSSF